MNTEKASKSVTHITNKQKQHHTTEQLGPWFCKPNILFDDFRLRDADYILELCTTNFSDRDGIKMTKGEGEVGERGEKRVS